MLKFMGGILLLCTGLWCFAQEDRGLQRAQQVMEALAAAYPDRIERAEFRDGDWTVIVRGIRYYYCSGRLLPEELRNKAADYAPQPFYNYSAELPPWKAPSAEDAERFRNMAANRSRNPVKRSPHFFDALWQAHTRDESQRRVKALSFLGSSVTVHEAIHAKLALVEERILADAQSDPQVRAWVNNINMMEGWNWRTIADTQTRSYHAYGAAVDILPKSLGGKETYWLWAARNKPEWWNIPYSDRLHPPAKVIKAFESRGFIWGGKWLFFDTMHFEYRPEIFLLSDKY
ncbi:MAG: M15 family metallopeptidase [Treponema sp.]|jgi:hypothetical protein|nr:M15 family metallopeptidase [Treponema sp.]